MLDYIAGLGGVVLPAGGAAVLTVLHSSQPGVRAAAAAAAGRIGIFEAAERLAALVGDAHWQVRFQAATALTRLGPIGRKLLEKTAADGEPLAREAAATILAEQVLER